MLSDNSVNIGDIESLTATTAGAPGFRAHINPVYRCIRPPRELDLIFKVYNAANQGHP